MQSLRPAGELYLGHARRVLARQLAPNRRLVCAATAYLATHATPKVPADLTQHNCQGIRQCDEAYGVWRFASGLGKPSEAVKVRGSLNTNDGEIAVNWALDGRGILMRAEWDIARHLASRPLVHLLPDFQTPPADVYAVYPQRHQTAARVRVLLEVASGKKTWAEHWKLHNALVLFNPGPVT